jgi:putative ABC transport system permease protein
MTATLTRAGTGGEVAERPRRRATWALAARLARREVRRRKGRTALVVALIAIPVLAMTVASVGFRTSRDTAAEEYRRAYGESDLVLQGASAADGLVVSDGTDRIGDALARLPAASRIVAVHDVYGQVRPARSGKPTFVRFTDLPLADPITSGMVDVQQGRAPSSPDEVLLSRSVARSLGVGVGDTLDLAVPAATYRVVGIGRTNQYLDDPLMVVGGFDFGSLRDGLLMVTRLVDLPQGSTGASLGFDGIDDPSGLTPAITPTSPQLGYRSYSERQGLAWGWVAGALALTVMCIIVAAAFASSARRQLVTLGQLSSNGAAGPVLRRTLALQGAWSGALGAVVGIVLGLAVILPQHGLLQRIAGHALGGMTVSLLDLAVIGLTGIVAATIAAFVPARSITKVPVMSALAGRRPLGTVPRRLVPVGVSLFAVGVGLIFIAAAAQTGNGNDSDRNLFAGVAVLGGLGVLFGMCCTTPAIIAVLGPLAERLTGTARLAARSLARVRTRSAAVVAAIAAAGALSIGVGTVVTSNWGSGDTALTSVPDLPANVVSVTAYANTPAPQAAEQLIDGALYYDDGAAPVFPALPDGLLDDVRAVLPDAQIAPIRTAGFDPAPYRADGSDAEDRWYGGTFTVADPALLDVIGMSADDLGRLERVGVVAGFVLSGTANDVQEVTAATQSGPVSFETVGLEDAPRSLAYAHGPLITPAKAQELGFVIGESGVLVQNPTDLTDAQHEQLQALGERYGFGSDSTFLPASAIPTVGVSISWGTPIESEVPKALIDGLIVGLALLFTLGVVAVGLSLSAAESRDERDVLLAIGAPPRSMRRVSALKAVLLAGIGGVLAVPTGFLPVAVVLAQVNDDPLRFPWLVALGCVVLVPVAVGLAALAGSTLAQRVKPVHMSTLAAD